MEDKTTSISRDSNSRIPFGMNAFGPKEQDQFGQSVRLAMACIEGKAEPDKAKAMASDEATIRQRLKTLSQEMSSNQADLLELLVRFDEMKGWEASGARHCAAWVNREIGLSLSMGWEYLRVGRKLRSLPITTALFRAGKLSWSIVRVLANVADADNEKTLCHAALDASVSEVVRLCKGYRWKDDDKGDGENRRAIQQWESRSLTWQENSMGGTSILLTLPAELARAFLNSVEHSLNQLDEGQREKSESSISQRRADAAVLMAESSLQAAGRDIATADRYQVILSVDESELKASDTQTTTEDDSTPSKHPSIAGAGPIAKETARRIACDCSVTNHTTTHGEPTDVGRKTRIWPAAMARAIKERDQHCQFNGCTQTQHLQVHHIKHWADGGTTSIDNGVSLCSACHTKVHEGGYSIQRVDNNEQRLNEQFTQQQHADDLSMFDFEKAIRNDRQSFDTVRKLSPTRFRFRVVDAQGRDIRGGHPATTKFSDHSPRGECAEPALAGYHCAEHPAVYQVRATEHNIMLH